MAKRQKTDDPSRTEESSKKGPTAGQLAVVIAGSAVDKLGVPMVTLLMILGAIRVMGKTETQDQFIQEVLFGSMTHTRHLSIFFASLIGVMLISGALTWRKKSVDESNEMKRIAKEKGDLQERLLGRRLSSSLEPMKEQPEGAETGQELGEQ